MGKKMTLIEIINNLANVEDDDMTIYAEEPWRNESKAILAHEPEAGGLPNVAIEGNLAYFLEVFITNEIMEDIDVPEFNTIEKKCKRLIEYAINDA